jgi:hypothetical protein
MGVNFLQRSKTSPACLQVVMQGGAGELVAQCHSLIEAMVAVDDKECRSTLGTLLKALMPKEHQVNEHS